MTALLASSLLFARTGAFLCRKLSLTLSEEQSAMIELAGSLEEERTKQIPVEFKIERKSLGAGVIHLGRDPWQKIMPWRASRQCDG
jgi:hypothetical protein